jgi:hypothetical protein
MLEQDNAVVAYSHEDGFLFIEPFPGDGDDGIPIHRQPIRAI